MKPLMYTAALLAVIAVIAPTTVDSATRPSSLTKRVKKLERRVRLLTIVQRTQGVRTTTDFSFARSLGNGYYTGDANCSRGDVTGGGVRWPGTGYTISGYPTAAGWHFYGQGDSAPQVYVVCAYVP